MGVEMTQHPEMWNAVVIEVRCSTCWASSTLPPALRGWANTDRCRVPDERAFLASISPYNQLKPDVNYPEPLIFTTTKDDRVGPVHARKFAAKNGRIRQAVLLR